MPSRWAQARVRPACAQLRSRGGRLIAEGGDGRQDLVPQQRAAVINLVVVKPAEGDAEEGDIVADDIAALPHPLDHLIGRAEVVHRDEPAGALLEAELL